jgi:hypothetical protein
MFIPTTTVIASISYRLILRVCQPQGEVYKFQFEENTNNFYKGAAYKSFKRTRFVLIQY